MNNIYKPRIVDNELKFKLRSKGAVLVEGCKWCGKTTTARKASNSELLITAPGEMRSNVQISEMAPNSMLVGDTPRLLDEWQVAPNLWDAVRNEVDRRNEPGQFILTGSSTPVDTSNIFHSGTGRFAWLKMRPMTLYESGESAGNVSLRALFGGEVRSGAINNLSDLSRIAFVCCRGGWPAILNQDEDVALSQAVDYVDSIVHNEISRPDNTNRDPDGVRRLMRSYARSQGSQASMETIIRDTAGDNADDELSRTAVLAYVASLKCIFAIEDMPAWNTNLRSKTAIRTSDTRYFVDPSIATAALDIIPNELMNDLNLFGFIFETLCVRDLRVYAEAMSAAVRHYRDKRGWECDAVIVRRDGSYGLVEIKLGGEKAIADGVESLEKVSGDMRQQPVFRMVLTANSPYAYQRKDGIYIVPIGCLGP